MKMVPSLVIGLFGCMLGTNCTHTADMQTCPPITWLPSHYKTTQEERVERRVAAIELCMRRFNKCPKWLKKTGTNSYWLLCGNLEQKQEQAEN